MDKLARYCNLVSGILLLTVGIIHLNNLFGFALCSSNCLGPYLNWSNGDFISDRNGAFRLVFALSPSLFLVNFPPALFGIIGILVHLQSFDLPYFKTWGWNCVYCLIAAFFGKNLFFI